ELQDIYVTRSVVPGMGDQGVSDGVLWIDTSGTAAVTARVSMLTGEEYTYAIRARAATPTTLQVSLDFQTFTFDVTPQWQTFEVTRTVEFWNGLNTVRAEFADVSGNLQVEIDYVSVRQPLRDVPLFS